MPLIQLFGPAAAGNPAERGALLSDLSRLAAEHFGKPERWVMTCFVPASLTFGGTAAPACFVAVKNIGKMTPDDTTRLSSALCERIAKALGIGKDRIYIDFADATDYLWGWNGETFG